MHLGCLGGALSAELERLGWTFASEEGRAGSSVHSVSHILRCAPPSGGHNRPAGVTTTREQSVPSQDLSNQLRRQALGPGTAAQGRPR